jgi:hypothetical protein
MRHWLVDIDLATGEPPLLAEAEVHGVETEFSGWLRKCARVIGSREQVEEILRRRPK